MKYSPFSPKSAAVMLHLLFFASLPTLSWSKSPLVPDPEQCISWGFDPTNLPCETCTALSIASLPSDVVLECQACCQSWRPNPYLSPSSTTTQKYKSATLIYDPQSLERFSEINDFINDADYGEKVRYNKGKAAFEIMEEGSDGSMTIRFGPPILRLYKGNKMEEPDEVVSLGGWKRDDLRDMLMTLLPDL